MSSVSCLLDILMEGGPDGIEEAFGYKILDVGKET